MKDFFNQFYDAVTNWRVSMSVSLLTFVLVVSYGLLNDLFLRRPEKSIANESIVLAMVLLIGLPLLSLTRVVRGFIGVRTTKVHRPEHRNDLPAPFLPAYALFPTAQSKALYQTVAHAHAQVQSKELAQAMAHLVAQAQGPALAQAAQAVAHLVAQAQGLALAQAAQAMAHLVAQAQNKALAQAMAHLVAQAQGPALAQAAQAAQAMAHLVAQAQGPALAQAMAQAQAQSKVLAQAMAQAQAQSKALAQAQALALAIREVADNVSYLPVSSVLAHIRQGRRLAPSERTLSAWHTSLTRRAPGEIAKSFDPCHIGRVSNRGTGLGLTIAYDISQKHFDPPRDMEATDSVLHGTISCQAR